MTACCTRSARSLLLAACVGLLFAVTACSGEDGSTGDCYDSETPPAVGFSQEHIYRAQVRLSHTVDYTADASAPSTDRIVAASFLDLSQIMTTSRPQEQRGVGGDACVALTGTVVTECREEGQEGCTIQYLDAEQVRISGVSSGPLDLPRTQPGTFIDTDVSAPLFGEAKIQVEVTSNQSPDFFPAFEQEMEPIAPLDVSEPLPGATELSAGIDIGVRWVPGNGDYVQIDLAPDDDDVTDSVRCFVADDGCHTIFADALDWLSIDKGEKIRLNITRHRATRKDLDDTTAAKLQAKSKVKMIVSR